MQQIVLIIGTVVASAIGLALLARIFGSVLRNARVPRPETFDTALFVQETVLSEHGYLANAIRGYDTPELHCQDEQLRARVQSRSFPDDLA
jgi:hypothetical protein